ncbi:MAG: hypothetical protein ACOC0D_00910 [Spirochaeta sp.]
MKRLWLPLILLWTVYGFPADGLEILESTFFPPQFFVGDQVEHVLVVRSEFAQQLRAPEELPQSQWMEFHSLQVEPHPEHDTAEIRMRFSAFVPGTVTLPVIHMGAESLQGREILVRSLQPRYGSELHEAQAQLLIPGTAVTLWLVSALVVALPLVWLLISHYGHSWLLAAMAKISEIRPYRRLRSRLRRLAKNGNGLSSKKFYIELLMVLRQYFSEKTSRDCMSATTFEVSRILETLSEDPEVVRELQEIFKFGDLVKFAGAQATMDIRHQHLITVFRVTAAIEQKESDVPAQVVKYVHS